ncbi:MAG: bifunctional phosphoglucose/phosphomannose isomerase [Candidatus Marinimicrobia bacterium]|jgi:glucose/mannose-6-phosphate isomerase|nr:bifunctional phosphoglucose/phosphomannose isomerase [Candidatus Neomarinimicrobiota bacterium]
MYKKIKNFPAQISNAINDTKDLSINLDNIHRVIIMGMGGSAIAGLIMKDISPHLEIIVERNYFPNAIIDEHTLLIICSYSGNTEESLSYYNHASALTNNIFGITSGGKLLKLLQKDNYNYCVLPEGYPPRSILGYTLAVLIKLLDEDELLELLNVELLQEYSDMFSLEDSEVFSLAKNIHSTFPVIVTEEDLSSIGYRLKCQLNENSKMLSYNVTLPEMNHNEIVGWESSLTKKDLFSLIWIDITFPANIKRMDITNRILTNKNSYSHHIEIPSDFKSDLSGLFYLINYLDWLSYWCGHLNDVDISSIKSIDILKKELA